jgi:hypothetical protein
LLFIGPHFPDAEESTPAFRSKQSPARTVTDFWQYRAPAPPA